MNLHENPEAFAELTQAAAQEIRLPQIYVEKDYWVTKALWHLAQSPLALSVVFKGGTSLSKAYRLIDRFSEDIDLAIHAAEHTDNQRKQLMRKIERTAAQGLSQIKHDLRESKGSRFRRTVYAYPKLDDAVNFGQASPQLLIEVNTFTSPEPFERRLLQSLIADFLELRQRTELIEQFSLQEFSLSVLSVKRTLIEKILSIIKDSYSSNPAERLANRIRHLYDICLILRKQENRLFLASDECVSLLKICINDEIKSFDASKSIFDRPLIEAPIFSKIGEWRPTIDSAYNHAFAALAYGEMPKMEEILDTISLIKAQLTRP
jgi:hypothetical protein